MRLIFHANRSGQTRILNTVSFAGISKNMDGREACVSRPWSEKITLTNVGPKVNSTLGIIIYSSITEASE